MTGVWNVSHASVSLTYIWITTWFSLCLQMALHLMMLGHQHAHWCLQTQSCCIAILLLINDIKWPIRSDGNLRWLWVQPKGMCLHWEWLWNSHPMNIAWDNRKSELYDDCVIDHKIRSTLAQVMACSLMAPSHYLNQCWHMISEVLWHSPDSNFTENTSDIHHWDEFEIY